ncbi:MAG TPA: hypothetical protein VFZ00_29910 [Solirubrobacter sp.]|nr:hypothetical protein [Solirubrobacter sp.]
MRRFAVQTGQTAAELLGALLIVSVIIAAVATTAVGGKLKCGLGAMVESIGVGAKGQGCGSIVTENVTPDDSDGDGLSDDQERENGSNPFSADSDEDGVPDDLEAEYGTNPNAADSDGDGITDAEEIENGLNPTAADSDGDGLSDHEEFEAGSDPLNADSDDDGVKDGDDDDPLAYDAGLGDAVQGALCGDSTWWGCPDDDDPVRASLAYFTGQMLTGLLAVGDIRDFVAAILRGKWGDAAWAAAGVVPYAGDAAKIGKKLHELITKFPGRRAELLRLIPKILPERLQRVAYDAATGGGWSKLADAGVSDDAIRRLAESGNDLRRLADNARLTERRLDDAEATAIWNAAKDPVWANTKRPIAEALGVETALAQLRKNPNVDVLMTGRPVPGRGNTGPDIVAIDRSTGRLIVVEAKGSTGGPRVLGRDRLRGTIGNKTYTQTERGWLTDNSDRYMRSLMRSTDPKEREAARRLQRVIDGDESYDVMIVHSRPASHPGYGEGMDEAVENIKGGGGVGDVTVVDVVRPR